MPTCAFITLGCKANQYDAQAMREALAGQGYRAVPASAEADVYVVSTCTVTGGADAKSGRCIRRLLREHPDSRIVVAGCGVDARAGYLGEFGERVIALGNREKMGIADVLAGGRPSACESWAAGICGFSGHTRAFVKIQEGCNGGCAYCIVPSVRGPSRERPTEDAIAEIERLAVAGYREIVLTGIHLGRHRGLAGIIRRASAIEGLLRLRLSSIEALEVTDGLLEVLASCPNACPHLHMPLQSGSDAVLRRMERPYSVGQFLEIVERIKTALDEPALTTDVIVGFPGETDSDFAATIEVCRRVGFSRIHIFRYSDRPGTAAAAMAGKCGSQVVTQRAHEMKRVAESLALACHERLVGTAVEVLVEHRRAPRSGVLTGLTERYVRVMLDGEDGLRGKVVRARVVGAAADHVAGVAETGS